MSEETKNELIRLLTSGNSIPDEYKEILFPTVNKEYELSYFGKMKREDILKDADGVFLFLCKKIKRLELKKIKTNGRICLYLEIICNY